MPSRTPRVKISRRNQPDASLRAIRNRFDVEATCDKEALLRDLIKRPPRSLRRLVRCHDDLLFLRAFPDNDAVHDLARRALDRLARQLQRIPRATRASLDDSGIASSNARHTFPYAIARWLSRSFPDEVEIDWPALPESSSLDALIRTVLTRAEEDGFDDQSLSHRDWLRLARPHSSPSALTWLLQRGEARAASRRVFAAIYDSAPLPLVWRLEASRGSTTNAELTGRASYRTAMRRPPEQTIGHIATPLEGIKLLQPAEANHVIRLARAALASRCREVFPISNANPDEVWRADLGAGTTLAIIGAAPPFRMSLETNYGYLLMSNGVPIGYGGVTPLFHQANTGINIFEPFRGSEGAFLWLQMLRAFHTLFGVRRFVVNPYQFGEGNAEAIQSGAFWFYYRLGFRPSDRETRALAAREASQLARRRTHRSTPSVLRALAHGDLHLTLPGFRETSFLPETLLSSCGLRVTARLATVALDREMAAPIIEARVLKALGVRSLSRGPVDERRALELLAPVVDLIPKLDRWTRTDRAHLVRLLRAKGAPQERAFVLESQAHGRFWSELRQILRSPIRQLIP